MPWQEQHTRLAQAGFIYQRTVVQKDLDDAMPGRPTSANVWHRPPAAPGMPWIQLISWGDGGDFSALHRLLQRIAAHAKAVLQPSQQTGAWPSQDNGWGIRVHHYFGNPGVITEIRVTRLNEGERAHAMLSALESAPFQPAEYRHPSLVAGASLASDGPTAFALPDADEREEEDEPVD